MDSELFDFPQANLQVVRRIAEDGVTLAFTLKDSAATRLHWGLNRGPTSTWCAPPESLWPAGTVLFNAQAVQSPFGTERVRQLTIRLPMPLVWQGFSFLLTGPGADDWIKNDRRDFLIPLPGERPPSPREALLLQSGEEPFISHHELTLDGGMRLAVGRRESAAGVALTLVCDAAEPVLLHWGVAGRTRSQWTLPPEAARPAGTRIHDLQAVQTPFARRGDLYWLDLAFAPPAEGEELRGLLAVLHLPGSRSWIKAGEDLYIPLFAAARQTPLADPLLSELADTLLESEVGRSSWSLMHRVNLCHDLLDRATGSAEALALLFVWMRYSALRQLDWQRHYNTKPRELAHAMERLTLKLARLWRSAHAGREWLLRMLGTLGRGGDGQRVRDEILHIMHRNGIKEMHGLFLEEWHQKLHNNTTGDDVVICEAYLAFLRARGDLSAFHDTLKRAGVTRERLAGFERPIRTDPQDWPEKRASLIREFENYLGILKSVHSGADLQVSLAAARPYFTATLAARLERLLAARSAGARPAETLRLLAEARAELGQILNETSAENALRELLFLDLALEELPRTELGRCDLPAMTLPDLLALITPLIDTLGPTLKSAEFSSTARHWSRVAAAPSGSADWALEAKSVADRLGRAVQSVSDRIFAALQNKADYLGRECGVEAWAIQIFSEEIIRGTPTFALSQLLRHLDPRLRTQAGLRGWQIISPASAIGTATVTESLIAAQGASFPGRTLLIADRVDGNEEIPPGVTSILTTDCPDIVSHLAVRARNARVLLATCFDPELYQSLKNRAGACLTLTLEPSGDIRITDTPAEAAVEQAARPPSGPLRLRRRAFTRWAVNAGEFNRDLLGGKSNNLAQLLGRLPSWIRFPASIALPFGGCEAVLADPANAAAAERAQALQAGLGEAPEAALASLRDLLLTLHPPAALVEEVTAAWRRAQLPEVPWATAWLGVQRVWASKWNDRAFYSRRSLGIPHDDLMMAVLIQQVVEADYAFVAHTVNPLNGDPSEVLIEVVLGLGETLVGNHPGRALGCLIPKAGGEPRLLAFPGKSLGLYGRGVIFRSDSNGEDLEDFAGAGLYESVLAEEPVARVLDYGDEPLVRDAGFRGPLLRRLAELAVAVENAHGSPQDIEGAVCGNEIHLLQSRPQVGLDKGSA